jgi:hypothetical protein
MIALTTSESYIRQLYNRMAIEIQRQLVVKSRVTRAAMYKNGVQWGAVYKDEFHQKHNPKVNVPSIMRRPEFKFAKKWAISGILCDNGSGDMAPYIVAMETDVWKKDKLYSQFTADKVAQITNEYYRFVK